MMRISSLRLLIVSHTCAYLMSSTKDLELELNVVNLQVAYNVWHGYSSCCPSGLGHDLLPRESPLALQGWSYFTS